MHSVTLLRPNTRVQPPFAPVLESLMQLVAFISWALVRAASALLEPGWASRMTVARLRLSIRLCVCGLVDSPNMRPAMLSATGIKLAINPQRKVLFMWQR